MPRMQIAIMKTRHAAAALADAWAPGGRSAEEYLMWRAALRQERADKHTMSTRNPEKKTATDLCCRHSLRTAQLKLGVLEGCDRMQPSASSSPRHRPPHTKLGSIRTFLTHPRSAEPSNLRTRNG